MSSQVINGISLKLSGPETLPLGVVLRGSPDYDGPQAFFTVTLTNTSDRTMRLPFDEISRNAARVYRNLRSQEELLDNKTPPPKEDGSTESLGTGESRSFVTIFEYPGGISTMEDRSALLQFCVKWEATWLRAAAYEPGAYDWNESFEICREIQIIDDR